MAVYRCEAQTNGSFVDESPLTAPGRRPSNIDPDFGGFWIFPTGSFEIGILFFRSGFNQYPLDVLMSPRSSVLQCI